MKRIEEEGRACGAVAFLADLLCVCVLCLPLLLLVVLPALHRQVVSRSL